MIDRARAGGAIPPDEIQIVRRVLLAFYRCLLSDESVRQRLVPELVLRQNDLIVRLSRERDVPRATLSAILIRLGETRSLSDEDAREALLRAADDYLALKKGISALLSDDPDVLALGHEAQAAIEQGRFALARTRLRAAAELELAHQTELEESVRRKRRSRAKLRESSAQTNLLAIDYREAALDFEAAAAALPPEDRVERLRLTLDRAEALQRQGERFGEIEALRESLRVYDEVGRELDPVRDREIARHHLINRSNCQMSLGEMTGDVRIIQDATDRLIASLAGVGRLDRGLLKLIGSALSGIKSILDEDRTSPGLVAANEPMGLFEVAEVDLDATDILAGIHNNYANIVDATLHERFDVRGAALSLRHRRTAERSARHGDPQFLALLRAERASAHGGLLKVRPGAGRKRRHFRLAQSCLDRAAKVRTREARPVDWAFDLARRAALADAYDAALGDPAKAREGVDLLDQALAVITPDQGLFPWGRLRLLRATLALTLPTHDPRRHAREALADLEATRARCAPLGQGHALIQAFDELRDHVRRAR